MQKINYLILIALLSGCYAPYTFKVKPIESSNNRILIINQLHTKFPYLIIHDSTKAWKLTNYSFTENNAVITGHLEDLPALRMTYKTVNKEHLNKAQKGFDKPFDEMHLWVHGRHLKTGDLIKITEQDLSDVQVYQAARNGGGKMVIGIGIVATLALIVAFIVFAMNY